MDADRMHARVGHRAGQVAGGAQQIGNLAVTMMLAALEITLMGYLGELIVGRRLWSRRRPER